jgi:cell division transport system permease protein
MRNAVKLKLRDSGLFPVTNDGAARRPAPIVPRNSITGHALAAVVAIMTFLASLTTGAVSLVMTSASEWQSDVAREITIQVRPVDGRNIEADVTAAARIARNVAGVADVRPYTASESLRLLEPWLGSGIVLDDLPVPRLIAVRVEGNRSSDSVALRTAIVAQIPNASVDDHRNWIGRMRAMAGVAIAGGLAVLMLVLAATILSVTFATRGAMATNRNVVEVLHLIGAKDGFIASQFQSHFLLLGLQGGALGGGAALAVLLLAGIIGDWLVGTAAGEQSAALFGSYAIGWLGYVAVVAQVALVAAVSALTSRRVVQRTLSQYQ